MTESGREPSVEPDYSWRCLVCGWRTDDTRLEQHSCPGDVGWEASTSTGGDMSGSRQFWTDLRHDLRNPLNRWRYWRAIRRIQAANRKAWTCSTCGLSSSVGLDGGSHTRSGGVR